MAGADGEQKARTQAYAKVEIDHLVTGAPLGFDLYLGSPLGGEIKFWGGEDRFTETVKKELMATRAEVFVLEEHREAYYDYLESQLKALVSDKTADVEEASRLAYDLSLHVMERVFERPEAETMSRAKDVIITAADLIMNDDRALLALLSLAKHDYYTYTHSCNVGLFSIGLMKQLLKEGQDHDIYALGAAFFFHDLGKIEVGLNIINKPGKLSEEEWEQMRRHPQYGFDILGKTGFLTDEARRVVLQHHERFDGSGYPEHLTAKDIHLYGRVCAITDVFDALTSERSYKKRLTPFEAARIMLDDMEGHFDPGLVRRFIQMFAGK